ncbi:MAG: ImmA/IrrE family metallo-endopeptidase [Rhodospirillaceae bacterium]|nr:ImmA/IrrE family metallo-endopeptidase [Rhodospirillaceae bacterium]
MAAQKANINSEILSWARKEAGISLAEAAQLAKISATKDKTAEQRLEEWEKNKDKPTQTQLAAIAKAYYRPVLTFYLPSPPAPNADVADFRTVGDGDVGTPSPKLRALVSKIKSRQQEMLELLKEENENKEPESLPFVGRFRDRRIIEEVAKDIEQVLNLPLVRRERLNDNDALLRLMRDSAEDNGIFVLAQGDLGSHHTDISPTEFRGFALADPIVPFIVLNDNDARAAQSFTLIHELAHLWIGDTGISNFDPFNGGAGGGRDNERFCNAVSAEFLMPKVDISRIWKLHSSLNLPEAIQTIARHFGVSRAAVGHRLWHLGEIDGGHWWSLYRSYQAEWAAKKKKLSESTDKPPPVYYPMKANQLGRRLVRTVLGALDAGEMSYSRASRILGVAPNGFEKLRSRVN